MAIDEKRSDHMHVTWVIIGAVAVVAIPIGIAVWRRRPRSQSEGPDSLSRLVVDALSTDWAAQADTSVEMVRSAILRGQPVELCSSLATLVEDVKVDFEFDGSGPVHVSVDCRYVDKASSTTATMDVPWERIPQEVRAQFLRGGKKTLLRHWRVS